MPSVPGMPIHSSDATDGEPSDIVHYKMLSDDFVLLEPTSRSEGPKTFGLNLLSGTSSAEDEATSNIRK